MRSLFATIFILLLGASTMADAAAQHRSTSLVKDILSVVRAQDSQTPPVILDDDDARERRRERTDRADRDESDARRGERGRGTVDGRGNRDVNRGSEGRAPTERGRRTGERADNDDPADARRSDDRRDDDDVWSDDVYRADQGNQGKRGNGPAFCRSGAGHPVFGTDWCQEKGFGRGDRVNDRGRENGPWDIRRDERGAERVNDGGWLEDILGRRDS